MGRTYLCSSRLIPPYLMFIRRVFVADCLLGGKYELCELVIVVCGTVAQFEAFLQSSRPYILPPGSKMATSQWSSRTNQRAKACQLQRCALGHGKAENSSSLVCRLPPCAAAIQIPRRQFRFWLLGEGLARDDWNAQNRYVAAKGSATKHGKPRMIAGQWASIRSRADPMCRYPYLVKVYFFI